MLEHALSANETMGLGAHLGFHVFVLVMVFKGLQAAHQLDASRT